MVVDSAEDDMRKLMKVTYKSLDYKSPFEDGQFCHLIDSTIELGFEK